MIRAAGGAGDVGAGDASGGCVKARAAPFMNESMRKAMKLRWEIIAPLGRPVVPLV